LEFPLRQPLVFPGDENPFGFGEPKPRRQGPVQGHCTQKCPAGFIQRFAIEPGGAALIVNILHDQHFTKLECLLHHLLFLFAARADETWALIVINDDVIWMRKDGWQRLAL
jgi:hypothetical protein